MSSGKTWSKQIISTGEISLKEFIEKRKEQIGNGEFHLFGIDTGKKLELSRKIGEISLKEFIEKRIEQGGNGEFHLFGIDTGKKLGLSRKIDELIDFARLNQALLNQAGTLVEQWIPGGKFSGAEYMPLNPKRGAASEGNFCININSGIWKDFAKDDDCGGDLVSLYAWLHNLTMVEAARELIEQLGIEATGSHNAASKARGRPVWTPILPIPDYAQHQPSSHPTLGKASHIWTYRDLAGVPLFYVYRFPTINKKGEPDKETRPLTFGKSSAGKQDWQWKGVNAPKPLYGLETLKLNADMAVIAEGEKSADAGRKLFPNTPVLTSVGGAGNSKHSDWTPLQGRDILICRDNDEPGLKYAQDVTRILSGLGCVVRWMRMPPDAVDGWDIADALEEGWDFQKILGLQDAGLFFMEPDLGATSKIQQPPIQALTIPETLATTIWPVVSNFSVNVDGVRDGHDAFIALRPIVVDAITSNYAGARGIQVTFQDLDFKSKTVALPARILGEQGGVLGKELLDLGFPIVPGKEKWLSRYLNQMTTQVSKRVFASTRLGWFENTKDEIAFILPSQILGDTAETITYQPDITSNLRTVDNLKHACTLKEWQTHVREECKDNPFPPRIERTFLSIEQRPVHP